MECQAIYAKFCSQNNKATSVLKLAMMEFIQLFSQLIIVNLLFDQSSLYLTRLQCTFCIICSFRILFLLGLSFVKPIEIDL